MEIFERMAQAAVWNRTIWTTWLVLLLIREAQVAFQALTREEAYDYKMVKEAILECLAIAEQHDCQRFRSKKAKDALTPSNWCSLSEMQHTSGCAWGGEQKRTR